MIGEVINDAHDQNDSIGLLKGEPITSLPQDLYIPPDALEVFLEAFQGPLDLLLYLIKKQNLDILDIPIAEITAQYMSYVEIMKELKLELAAEYLVMAGMLAEIKSRMLLPRPKSEDDEDDPRAELIRRLQEYERFKEAAENLDSLPRMERDNFEAAVVIPELNTVKSEPEVDLQDLWFIFQELLERAKMFTHHRVEREMISTRDKMVLILNALQESNFVSFPDLFNIKEGRLGIIVTFSALLELLKQSMIELVQTKVYGEIHIKKVVD
ncbi:MAG: segregation/condensation protein A [Gammaproteobacteria bacterium]|nr:segregation/condensation protein A [Gammaproteobacteria bacterium]